MKKNCFFLTIILICCLSLVSINSFAAEMAWETLDDSEISITREADTITVKGNLEEKGDSDTVYLISDSRRFMIEFEYPPANTDFWVEIFWGNGTTTNKKYQLSKTKYITPAFLGEMYLKIYSKKGSGEWGFKYVEKEKRLIDFTWTITIGNKSRNVTATKVEVKVPVIRTFEKYQDVLESSTNLEYKKIATDNLGNDYYIFELLSLGPKSSVDIVMHYKILLKADYSIPEKCEGETISDFLKPEPLIESNDPYIINLAKEITKDDITDCEKAESIYHYVLKNFVYGSQSPMDGALKALKRGKGDCNEFTDSIIALSRASGISARKGNGFVFFGKDDIRSHAFSEMFLPGIGWSVVDATMCCLIKRPPFYIYSYIGENPSFLVKPDIEDHYYYYWWETGKGPEMWLEDKFEAKELE